MVAVVLALLLAQEPVEVEGQPLAAQVARLAQALELLGHPLRTAPALKEVGENARDIQLALQSEVLLEVTLGATTTMTRGRAPARLQQAGFTPHVIRIVNGVGARPLLRVTSPQSGPVYAGVAPLSMQRQAQQPLRENENVKGDPRFLQLELVQAPPMTAGLSGLKVEYVVLLIYSSEAGKSEAVIDVEGASISITFEVRPALPVRLALRDVDGKPTMARLVFTDALGRVYPPQPKRLVPDLFFQKQIYRQDGETVLLPPGTFQVIYGRGPEYLALGKRVTVTEEGENRIDLDLRRWIDPMSHGYYSGDHHIHAAGCAHYTKPSEGVLAADMFRQVKGEGLNVGCLLTWGPCFDYQKNFFQPTVDKLSEPLTLIKYDIEVSGFGSQALGHVCLLNLKDQQYPGSIGATKWPTWTTPVLRWAKQQGAITGYAHSASGLQIHPANAAKRLMAELDRDKDGFLTEEEVLRGLIPADSVRIDAKRAGHLHEVDLAASLSRAADELPNWAVPEMNSVGAMEIFVTVPQGLCDFISAMDTARIPEWNCWYHLMNCGFPLKVSGETDFPCMSGTRVGQGRVYVHLGKVEKLDYGAWCDGVAKGRSYVSDGYAHALEFSVNGKAAGATVELENAGTVRVSAKVAFARQTPFESPYGTFVPSVSRSLVGDTVDLHPGDPRPDLVRTISVVVNGASVRDLGVFANDGESEVSVEVPIQRSSWITIRQFPQLHTNPVNVIVAGQPIRASRKSALWCIACIEQLWRVRGQGIAAAEREEAKKAFDAAIEVYRKIAAECPEGS